MVLTSDNPAVHPPMGDARSTLMAARAARKCKTILYQSITRSTLEYNLDRLLPTVAVVSRPIGLLSSRELKKIVAQMVD
ncbi:MAG: hypothetical protein I8H86_05015 [Sphingomonadaceae bacterium]|nr:hypothetical protein [Sphingomonadaceae bacterium]MBH2000197.1 hypothetical protein [Sphingomonadaceae bacterium]